MGYLWRYLYAKILEISSVSNFEYISIIGHYNKLTLVKQIDPRLLTRGYTEEQLKILSSKIGLTSHEFISLNLHFRGDVDRWEYLYFDYVMTLWDAYENRGLLPFTGCHAEQPAKIIELFNILSQLKLERQNKLHEEQRREQEKTNRKTKKK